MTEDVTLDSVLRGEVQLYQHRAGYRVNVDPLLLVDFAGAPPFGRVLDLGAGVGVIGLALARRDPAARVDAVEVQPALAALAQRNAELNQVAARVTVHEADLRQASLGALFDLVVSNPPYQPAGSGPPPAHGEKAIARHEVACTLAAVVAALARHLRVGGRGCLIYPAEREPELTRALAAAGLSPARLRRVHPRPTEPAQRVLIEAVRGAETTLAVLPPLTLWDDAGKTPEHRRIVGE